MDPEFRSQKHYEFEEKGLFRKGVYYDPRKEKEYLN